MDKDNLKIYNETEEIMLTVFRYNYEGQERIGLCESDDGIGIDKFVKEIETLPSVLYCEEIGFWHIKKNSMTYKCFLDLKVPFRIDRTTDTIDALRSKKEMATNDDTIGIGLTQPNSVVRPGKDGTDILPKKGGLFIKMQGDFFVIDLPYNEVDVLFVKRLKRAYWHSNNKVWLVKATILNLERLQEQFVFWRKLDYEKIETLIKMRRKPISVELYETPDSPQQVMVKVSGYGVNVDFLKRISGRNYDKEFRRWMVPKDDKMIKRIIEYFEQYEAKIVNRIAQQGVNYNKNEHSLRQRQSYLLDKQPEVYRRLIKEYTDVMIVQRYSWETIKSYTVTFVKFAAFYKSKHVRNLSEEEVNRYVSEIAFSKVSESMINKVVSCIKFYYTKVAFQLDFEIERIKRPRKSTCLPTILSIQEVNRLLGVLDNLKHVCILYTLYSSGLRLGEILALRMSDLSFDRSQILIAGAKGKKDRMVMMSERLKPLMQLYIDNYKPMHWVFEGQDRRGPYSQRSVQSIVKSAATKAGIRKRVSPHTLRHCFATHLLDGGTNVRYIQDLLGHKDIKTTLIYTHVTMKRATSVQSPLDQLEDNIKQVKNK